MYIMYIIQHHIYLQSSIKLFFWSNFCFKNLKIIEIFSLAINKCKCRFCNVNLLVTFIYIETNKNLLQSWKQKEF